MAEVEADAEPGQVEVVLDQAHERLGRGEPVRDDLERERHLRALPPPPAGARGSGARRRGGCRSRRAAANRAPRRARPRSRRGGARPARSRLRPPAPRAGAPPRRRARSKGRVPTGGRPATRRSARAPSAARARRRRATPAAPRTARSSAMSKCGRLANSSTRSKPCAAISTRWSRARTLVVVEVRRDAVGQGAHNVGGGSKQSSIADRPAPPAPRPISGELVHQLAQHLPPGDRTARWRARLAFA